MLFSNSIKLCCIRLSIDLYTSLIANYEFMIYFNLNFLKKQLSNTIYLNIYLLNTIYLKHKYIVYSMNKSNNFRQTNYKSFT